MEHMPDEELDRQDATDAQDSSEEYTAPKLTDLGSFEELTRLTAVGPNPDAEGLSA
jgi:hypothetical protein